VRIALVTKRTDPKVGGAEKYTFDLAQRLEREGHDVSVLAATPDHVPVGTTPVKLSAGGLTRLRRYDRLLASLDEHLDATPYDIVHAMLPVHRCDVYHPHAGLARAMAAGDKPSERVLNPRRDRRAAVEGTLLDSPNAPVVLCLSEYVRASVRAWYALDDAHLPILFNAVDTHVYDPAARPDARAATRARLQLGPDDCVALFVGQDLERKGLREAVLAMQAFRENPRMRLVIVGRPSAREYLGLADRIGVRDRVIKAPYSADVYAFYQAADFLVLPTKHDPCSLVVLEALAMGLPVISTRFNGACEIMSEGVHGHVLDDPADVPRLSLAMETMLDDGTRRRMSEACVALRPKLEYDQHVRTLAAIYDRVLSARGDTADRYTS